MGEMQPTRAQMTRSGSILDLASHLAGRYVFGPVKWMAAKIRLVTG